MINESNLSFEESNLIQLLETESGSSFGVSEKARIYEITNIMSGHLALKKKSFKTPDASMDFLKEKYINECNGSKTGYLLLNSQHQLILDHETPELMARDLLSLIIKHNAAAIISYEVLFEAERDIDKMDYRAVREIVGAADIRLLDHIDLDFFNLKYESLARLGVI